MKFGPGDQCSPWLNSYHWNNSCWSNYCDCCCGCMIDSSYAVQHCGSLTCWSLIATRSESMTCGCGGYGRGVEVISALYHAIDYARGSDDDGAGFYFCNKKDNNMPRWVAIEWPCCYKLVNVGQRFFKDMKSLSALIIWVRNNPFLKNNLIAMFHTINSSPMLIKK